MKIRMKKILWPTDLSSLSLTGAGYARALCEAFDAKLYVIHVAPVLISANAAVPMMTGGEMLVTSADTVGPATAQLQRLAQQQFGRLGKVELKVVVGEPWYEICQYAQKTDIDLIVVATHGLTGLKHLLMGSTAERVVRHASCPVLTVKSFERDFGVEKKASKKSTAKTQSGLATKQRRA